MGYAAALNTAKGVRPVNCNITLQSQRVRFPHSKTRSFHAYSRKCHPPKHPGAYALDPRLEGLGKVIQNEYSVIRDDYGAPISPVNWKGISNHIRNPQEPNCPRAWSTRIRRTAPCRSIASRCPILARDQGGFGHEGNPGDYGDGAAIWICRGAREGIGEGYCHWGAGEECKYHCVSGFTYGCLVYFLTDIAVDIVW